MGFIWVLLQRERGQHLGQSSKNSPALSSHAPPPSRPPLHLKTAQQQGNEVVTWQLLNGAVFPKYKTNKFLTALLLCYELKILKLNPRTQPSLSSLTLMNSDHRIVSATCSCIVNSSGNSGRSAPRRQQRQ